LHSCQKKTDSSCCIAVVNITLCFVSNLASTFCSTLSHIQVLSRKMSIYEEIEIEDMTYDEAEMVYTYPCPCGDKFRITLEELWDGEDIATCPSCTLRIEVIYEEEDLPELPPESDEEEEELTKQLQDLAVKA